WPRSFTPVTYSCKLLGIRSLAALLQHALFGILPLFARRSGVADSEFKLPGDRKRSFVMTIGRQ
ncbi:hypothetical protein, partial [Franconibacter pulveris]|uniref:hypothetical protein n=1 Tax=Franconibacter pulveris TaxID=435910 RepID=UPI000463FB5B